MSVIHWLRRAARPSSTIERHIQSEYSALLRCLITAVVTGGGLYVGVADLPGHRCQIDTIIQKL